MRIVHFNQIAYIMNVEWYEYINSTLIRIEASRYLHRVLLFVCSLDEGRRFHHFFVTYGIKGWSNHRPLSRHNQSVSRAKKGLIASIKTSHSWYCHHDYTVLATFENLYDSKPAIVLNMALFNTESIHWQLNDNSSRFTFVMKHNNPQTWS